MVMGVLRRGSKGVTVTVGVNSSVGTGVSVGFGLEAGIGVSVMVGRELTRSVDVEVGGISVETVPQPESSRKVIKRRVEQKLLERSIGWPFRQDYIMKKPSRVQRWPGANILFRIW
jgi:hypothetical protein